MHLPGLVSLLLLSAPALATEPAAQPPAAPPPQSQVRKALETDVGHIKDILPCSHPPMRPERISGEDLQFDPSRLAHLDEDETTYMLKCTFKVDGKVTGCLLLKPGLGLDAKNRETLKQWRFKPALLNDKPVATTCTLSGKLTPRPSK